MRKSLRAARTAFLPLLTPVIIVGGIVFGIFTPTEAAIAAVAYTTLVGTAVLRTLNWRKIVDAMTATIETTAHRMTANNQIREIGLKQPTPSEVAEQTFTLRLRSIKPIPIVPNKTTPNTTRPAKSCQDDSCANPL